MRCNNCCAALTIGVKFKAKGSPRRDIAGKSRGKIRSASAGFRAEWFPTSPVPIACAVGEENWLL
jgi:hypothetical protein